MIAPDEITWTYSRSSGAGGQNVNKVNSQVSIRWTPADSKSISDSVRQRFIEKYKSKLTSLGEIIIKSDRFRDQPRNASDCLEKLEEMIRSVLYPPKKRVPTRPTKGSKKRRLESKRKDSELKKSRSKHHYD